MPTVTLNNARGQKAISLQGLTASEWHELFGTGESSSTPNAESLVDVVGWLHRCVHLRASALSSMPWTITHDGEVIFSNGDAGDAGEFEWLAELGDLLYLTEASLSIVGSAYWYILRDRRDRVIKPRWFAPGTMEPVWDTSAGLVGFERQVGSTKSRYPVEDIVYTRLPNPLHETLPGTSPAHAAAAEAGVLFNLNAFAEGYFERGAIRATLLSVQGNMRPDEKERLKAWWQRMISGVSNAWGAGVINAESIKPITVGDGIEALSNNDLTKEKREGISTAMGVPHALVMSNAANYATALSDKRLFYEGTIIPQGRNIAQAINQQMLAPLGLTLKFDHQSLSMFQEDEKDRSTAYLNYVQAGMQPSVAAQVLGIDLPGEMEYESLDAPEVTFTVQDRQPVALPGPQDSAPESTDEPPSEAKRAEIGQLRRWLKRLGPAANLDGFNADHLSNVEKRVVWVSLFGENAEDVTGKDNPFSEAAKMMPGGRLTRDAWKALRLQLDPEDNEAEQRARDGVENGFRNELQAELQRWKNQIVPANGTDADVRTAAERVTSTNGKVRDVLRKWLLISSDLGVNIAIDQFEAVGFGFDYTLAHNRAAQWAQSFVGELIQGITNTTRQRVQSAVSDFFTNADTMRDLRRELEPLFGPKRADLIASTEATRAAAEGSKEAYQESGVVDVQEWVTANDEIVRQCPVCAPMHGQVAPLGESFTHPDNGNTYFPPAHPRCRCWIIPVIDDEPSTLVQGAIAAGDNTNEESRTYSPSGVPVSRALSGPSRGKNKLAVDQTLDSIDQVHGDGNLPEIPVKFVGKMNSFGYYKYGGRSGKPINITIRSTGDHRHLTLAHEAGHFIDHQGTSTQWVTATSEAFKPWRDAIKNSKAYKSLDDMLADPDKYIKPYTDPRFPDFEFTRKPDRRYLRYQLGGDELWARSYSQYIATKSRQPDMIAELAGLRENEMYKDIQWDDDDFAPIAEAIDQAFVSLGWLK